MILILGNANSGRKRNSYVTEALVIEMKSREESGDKAGIRALAVKVWDLAESGERWAAEYIRDTIDGKPLQQIAGILTLVSQEDALAELDGQPAEAAHERPDVLN